MKRIIGFMLSLTLLFAFAVPAATVNADAPMRIRVACVGDSITEGDTTTNKSATAYPAQLQSFLGEEYLVKNFGASGHAALKEVGYVQSYWKNSKYSDSLAFEPNIVIIMLGTNDVIDPKYTDDIYAADMKALIDSYKALPTNPEIYIATAPCVYAEESNNRAERVQTVLLPVQKKIAEDNGCKLVDINEKTQNMSEFYTDGLHPNDAGYLKLAQFMYEGVFGLTASKVTFKTERNNIVCLGGQQVEADGNGNAELITGDGNKTFTVTREGMGFAYVSAEIKGNTEIDCTGLLLPQNIAVEAAVTDASGAVTQANDLDSSTGWQRSDSINNAWLILNFSEAKDINSILVEWEGGNRAHHDRYYFEYSVDGESWTKISNAAFVYGMDIDTVSFDTLRLKQLRIKVEESMKGNVKINEIGVFKTDDGEFTPIVKYENQPEESQPDVEDEKAGINPIIIVAIAGGALLVVGVVAVLIIIKRKKGVRRANDD